MFYIAGSNVYCAFLKLRILRSRFREFLKILSVQEYGFHDGGIGEMYYIAQKLTFGSSPKTRVAEGNT